MIITGGPGGETNQFRIVFRDVDDEVCAALGDAYAGRSRARAGIVSLTINGTALTSPVTVAQVTANCDDGAGANDKGTDEPIAVREFRIAKRQPRPMPTDR